jgi:hypothetical protein
MKLNESVISAIDVHSKKLDDDVNTIINELIPQRIAEVEEETKKTDLSLVQKQETVSRISCTLTQTLDIICHWIAMQQERLECGNEFGSEVQATVAASLVRSVSTSHDRKENLTGLILDSLNLEIPKYAPLRDTEIHRTIKASLQRDYERSYQRFLQEIRRSYFRVLSVLLNNRSALVDPKNKKGEHAHHSEDPTGLLFV